MASAPAITTNIVVFSLRDSQLKLLLVRRGAAPFKSMWALPGGDLQADEDLDTGALRALEEGTGLSGVYLEQLFTFGAPDRDPRQRTIAFTYVALIPLGPSATARRTGCRGRRLVLLG